MWGLSSLINCKALSKVKMFVTKMDLVNVEYTNKQAWEEIK